MPELLNLKTFAEDRGFLTVLEEELPFEIKRVFYIYKVDDSVRGKHRHRKTIQAAICIKGRCTIHNDDGKDIREFVMDSPEKCLVLYPADFHSMANFSEDAILLVLASAKFDASDYIYEPYNK